MGMLDGKVAVVSGLGPGMGRDISLALAAEGADIVMAARQEKRMARCAPEVEALGRRALPVVCDITSEADCAALVEQVRTEFGKLDILVNNAFSDGDHQLFMDSTIESWRSTMDVNFFGTMQLTRAAVPLLTEQADSRIIMINTMSTQRIDPAMGAYAASKAALANATKTLAVELGRDGVRVNGVHPGYIWGRSVEWYFNQMAEQRGITFQEVYDEIAGTTCLGYLPSSEEIAGAVLFFASPLSKPITGQYLSVNAGHFLA
jgi:NAD(P)-dependent dehydrogenase (short-subunit alcohol dehydrogenase family)